MIPIEYTGLITNRLDPVSRRVWKEPGEIREVPLDEAVQLLASPVFRIPDAVLEFIDEKFDRKVLPAKFSEAAGEYGDISVASTKPAKKATTKKKPAPFDINSFRGKDALEEAVKERYGVDLDKRLKLSKLKGQTRKLEILRKNKGLTKANIAKVLK